ncbi:hypothetical protein BpHYR1_032408 [Brachionus plicatilis]|uniref:Uncharacterized protein n=1 Tax=Brachionus plicatilis TaxID=10195 RepID=A0A3M7PBS7_BRAPC|nr:hypothetical protein BpHYR1_032408 [Brachionus plicatilis]
MCNIEEYQITAGVPQGSMNELIDCFSNLNIEHGFKFGWRCTYPSCSSTCETNVSRMSDDNPRKIIVTVRSDVLLKDEEEACGSSYERHSAINKLLGVAHPN